MADGRVLVSDCAGTYVLKLTGDVRVTLCATVDDFIEGMFADAGFRSVVVDLSETEAIDSTTLGLLARLSIRAGQRQGGPPVLLTPNPDITRILVTMGLDDVFQLIQEVQTSEPSAAPDELPRCTVDAESMRSHVLDAHRTLMSLNEHNQEAFRELVANLESEA